MSRHHQRGPRSINSSTNNNNNALLAPTTTNSTVSLNTLLKESRDDVIPSMTASSTTTTTQPPSIIPSAFTSSNLALHNKKANVQESDSSSDSDNSNNDLSISSKSSVKNSKKRRSKSFFSRSVKVDSKQVRTPLIDVDEISLLSSSEEQPDSLPPETNKEKKAREKVEIAKMVKKNKKRVYRCVSLCLVPLAALAMLKRALESFI